MGECEGTPIVGHFGWREFPRLILVVLGLLSVLGKMEITSFRAQ